MVGIEKSEIAYRILLALLEGEKRFSQILKEGKKGSVAKIMQDLLKQRYIKRRLIDSKPPKTVYSLTEIGKKLLEGQKKEWKERLTKDLERLKLLEK